MLRAVRPPCAGSVVCRSGEASQAIMCWGDGAPVRPPCAGGVACRSGHRVLGGWRAGQSTMYWEGGGGGCAGQVIMCIVRISYHSS